jgi:uncharacterized protein (DUF2147 family)
MKFRDLVEGKLDKKLLAAAEKLIIKMKKDKETNTKIIKALEVNFPSLNALHVLGDFKNARVDESHFEIGDEVICKASGSEGKIVKIDEPEEGKYYTVKREDGTTKKYAPEELKLEDEEDEELDESVQGQFQLKIRKAKKGECEGIMKDIEAAFKAKKINEKEFDMLTAMCGRKMDKLDEAQDADFVLQALADADINAKIEGDTVIVDKDDVKETKKVLKKIKCGRKVKSGLNEGEEDVIFSKEMNGQELKVHVHEGKFICKVNGKELK